MKFRRTKKKTEVVDKDVQECPVEVVCAMVPFVTKEGHMRFRYSFSHEAPFSERQTAVTTFHVPSQSVEAYKHSTAWSSFANKIQPIS